jgi:hypothetical protein
MKISYVNQVGGEVQAAGGKKQCGGGRKSKAKAAAPVPTKDPQSVAAKVQRCSHSLLLENYSHRFGWIKLTYDTHV